MMKLLKRPRKVMLRSGRQAGGDDFSRRCWRIWNRAIWIIDGGNSHFRTPSGATSYWKQGPAVHRPRVSGGEEGARFPAPP